MRVNATPIAQIDYSPEHGKLFVTFHDGDEYVYVGVPERVSTAFVRSPVKGRFFQRIIRDRYPYNRM
ncbi:MAG: KTSC domain-containing protein [Alphaproteobacteria bacterium]|nr:KTSC domain-containing protein [Alphaproteobacteria bacterium]